jgi:hypothetical protein
MRFKQKISSEKLRGLLIAAAFLFATTTLRAQEVDYSIHANIIYHFTKYIEWPDNKKSGEFIIGVICEIPLIDDLQELARTKTANGHKIIIKTFSASQSSYNCNILFIGEDENNCLKKVSALTAESSVLILTETKGSALRGSCINFSIAEGKLKLEINKNVIENRGLKIASELLSLGKIVS